MKYLIANTSNITEAFLIHEKFSKHNHNTEIYYKNYTRIVDKKRKIERVYLTAINIGEEK